MARAGTNSASRVWERWLLLAVFLVVAAGYTAVLLARSGGAPESGELMPLVAFGASLVVVHLVTCLFNFRGDAVLMSAALLLAGVGILVQFRLGTLEVVRSGNWSSFAFPMGVGAMLAVVILCSGGRWRMLQPLYFVAGIAAISVIAFTLATGQKFRGATYAAGNLTPTEIIKVLLPVFLAGFFARNSKDLAQTGLPGIPAPSTPTILTLGFFWGVPMVLLVLQHDLGMILLLNAMFLILLSIASRRFGYLFVGILVATTAAFAAMRFAPHVQSRVEAWAQPFHDTTGGSFQIMKAQLAFNSGGLWGRGLGAGDPQNVPIVSSDFVYAALGEEIGYVGCGLVILLYLILCYRGFRIADSLKEPFAQFLAAGLIAVIAFQTLLNIGGVTKALPLTGITLPFISHGGSSLITCFVALGLLLALSEREGGARK